MAETSQGKRVVIVCILTFSDPLAELARSTKYNLWYTLQYEPGTAAAGVLEAQKKIAVQIGYIRIAWSRSAQTKPVYATVSLPKPEFGLSPYSLRLGLHTELNTFHIF